MSISTIVKKVIRKYGQDIVRKKRLESADRGYYYSEPEVIRGQVSQLTGYAEQWEIPGIRIKADYLVTFTPDVDIEVGDILKINDEWIEVVEKLVRTTGTKIDFVECLCRRRETV